MAFNANLCRKVRESSDVLVQIAHLPDTDKGEHSLVLMANIEPNYWEKLAGVSYSALEDRCVRAIRRDGYWLRRMPEFHTNEGVIHDALIVFEKGLIDLVTNLNARRMQS